jgi:hypothetical protein
MYYGQQTWQECVPSAVPLSLILLPVLQDTCAANSVEEHQRRADNGFNLCQDAAATGGDNFGISMEALGRIRTGSSWELRVGYEQVPC